MVVPIQWSIYLTLHQDHLEDFFKHKLLSPSSEFLIQDVGVGPKSL